MSAYQTVRRGLQKLTGYAVEDAVGRNCRFLSYGVPIEKRDAETTDRLKAYTQVATSGDPFFLGKIDGVAPSPWAEEMPNAGSYFCRWNRRKNGELFRNLFLLRQIWLGPTQTYIVALQTELPANVKLDANSEATHDKLHILWSKILPP